MLNSIPINLHWEDFNRDYIPKLIKIHFNDEIHDCMDSGLSRKQCEENWKDENKDSIKSSYDNIKKIANEKPFYRGVWFEDQEDVNDFVKEIGNEFGGTGLFWSWDKDEAKPLMHEYHGSIINKKDPNFLIVKAVVKDPRAIDFDQSFMINIHHDVLEKEIRLRKGCKYPIHIESITRGSGEKIEIFNPIACAGYHEPRF